MIHSVKFKVVLDTNVIYPMVIRDILFWFAHYNLFTPQWSQHIFDEWKDVIIRRGIPEEEAFKRVNKANLAFPDALVQQYEGLINHLKLPDPKDCHVLAAAIKVNAKVIVTNNIKDFPEDFLEFFGIKAKTADDFLTDLIDLNQKVALEAFKEMVLNKTNPSLDEYQVLDRLRNAGLNDTANYLHSLL